MNKKILIVMLALVVMVSALTNTYAADNFLNLGIFETAYKLSNEANIRLPFINIFAKGATYDEVVEHSGISIGESTIDVDEKLEGIHLILSQDMVTIKGEVEHGIIYGTNIVVEGKISGDTILMANSIKILEDAIVEKDVIMVGDVLEMNGTVKGNLIGAVSQVNLKGTIEGDMRLDTTSLSLDSGIVEGNIYIRVPEGVTKNITGVTEKYPNAVIDEQIQTTENNVDGEYIAKIVFDGVKVVIIYTIIGLIITKKENNIVRKAAARFTENSSFGMLTGVAMLMLALVIPILLIVLGCIGLGTIAWPVLIVYLALILLSISISSFVVGMTIYQALKSRIGKYKIPVLAGVFAVIYTLTKVPYISGYMLIAINVVSMAVIMSYIFKREENKNTVIEAKVIDNSKDKKQDK